MKPVYYRAMREDRGGQFLRTTATGLCVRVRATAEGHGDVFPDAAGMVAPGTGGMSVAGGSWKNLPFHRVPPRYEHLYGLCEGHPKANLYQVSDPTWQALTVRHVPLHDAEHHYQVEPRATMTVAQLNEELWCTAADWYRFEPES